MIATPHVAASAAGLDVLRRGGTAIDAAVAANAVLAVVYPASNGVGGDAFALVWDAKRNALRAYNGSGRAPLGLSASLLRERGLHAMPVRGPLTVTVPGAVRAWETLAGEHGRFGLDALLAYAQSYAQDGFVVTDVVAEIARRNAAVLAAPAADGVFDGLLRSGEVVRNEALARTLGAIRARGSDAFYSGEVAQAIVATLQAAGSPMSLDDLAQTRTQEMSPLSVRWQGRDVCAHPPNSQAILGPFVLGVLGAAPVEDEFDWHHLAIEAFKLAFDERDARFGEPATMQPIDDLLSPAVHARLRQGIDLRRARSRDAFAARGGTIGIVAADADGNAISLIESLYMSFGSGIVARGTGVFLQNRGAYFSLEGGHPNELRPGARPVHTLSPGMLLEGGRPVLLYATMGGDGQTQTHVQFIHNVVERGMSLQQALDAPRFVYGRDSESAFADTVRIESSASPEVIEALRARGHHVQVEPVYDHAFGHAHAIGIDYERGTFSGAADPRADSAALPL